MKKIIFVAAFIALRMATISAMEKQSSFLEEAGFEQPIAENIIKKTLDLLIASDEEITPETVAKFELLLSNPVSIDPKRFLYYMSRLISRARSLKSQYKDYIQVMPHVDVESGARAKARADEYKAQLLPVLSLLRVFAKKADSPDLQESEFAQYYQIPEDIKKAFGEFNV